MTIYFFSSESNIWCLLYFGCFASKIHVTRLQASFHKFSFPTRKLQETTKRKTYHQKQEMRQPFVSYPHQTKPNVPVNKILQFHKHNKRSEIQCSTLTFLEPRQWAKEWNKSLAQKDKTLVQKKYWGRRGLVFNSLLKQFINNFYEIQLKRQKDINSNIMNGLCCFVSCQSRVQEAIWKFCIGRHENDYM